MRKYVESALCLVEYRRNTVIIIDETILNYSGCLQGISDPTVGKV